MTYILLLRVLVDFGLLVLIWMIQLIVYPSFLHYQKENLITWHKKYTLLISYIVAPLMLMQLGAAIFIIIREATAYNVLVLLLIGIIWATTFLQFVPIHSAISKGNFSEEQLQKLVNRNWIRTLLWTVLFVLNLIPYFSI